MKKKLPDWAKVTELLIEHVRISIKEYLTTLGNEKLAFFGLATYSEFYDDGIIDDEDEEGNPIPPNRNIGRFQICFDTEKSQWENVRERYESIIGSRTDLLQFPKSWQRTDSYIGGRLIYPYTDNMDLFAYISEYDLSNNFIGFDVEKLPKNPLPRLSRYYPKDSYVEGNLKIVLWDALQAVAKEELFPLERVTSPFYMGFSLFSAESADIIVTHIKNLPK